jgi:hypothetical protein
VFDNLPCVGLEPYYCRVSFVSSARCCEQDHPDCGSTPHEPVDIEAWNVGPLLVQEGQICTDYIGNCASGTFYSRFIGGTGKIDGLGSMYGVNQLVDLVILWIIDIMMAS